MDNNISTILDEGGWYENRSINIDYEVEIIQKEGYISPNEMIMTLLREFWNLKLEFILPDGQFSDIELNVETALSNFDDDAVKIYEKIVNEKLIPVAVMHFRTSHILVSLKSNFYMIADGEIYFVANSFMDFLDVIINRKQVVKYSFQQ